MEGLRQIPVIVMMLGISAIILGAFAVSMGKFGSVADKCYNASYSFEDSAAGGFCNNLTTNVAAPVLSNYNLSDSYFAIRAGKSGFMVIGEQFPTVAVVAVMVIIIGLIAGIFAYFQFF